MGELLIKYNKIVEYPYNWRVNFKDGYPTSMLYLAKILQLKTLQKPVFHAWDAETWILAHTELIKAHRKIWNNLIDYYNPSLKDQNNF